MIKRVKGTGPNVPRHLLVQLERDLAVRAAELFAVLDEVPAGEWRERFRALVVELDEYAESRAAELGVDLDEAR